MTFALVFACAVAALGIMFMVWGALYPASLIYRVRAFVRRAPGRKVRFLVLRSTR